MMGFVGPSFETISAVDDHAASPHYKSTETSGTREITKNCVYLIDSGGHYRFAFGLIRCRALSSLIDFRQMMKAFCCIACAQNNCSVVLNHKNGVFKMGGKSGMMWKFFFEEFSQIFLFLFFPLFLSEKLLKLKVIFGLVMEPQM